MQAQSLRKTDLPTNLEFVWSKNERSPLQLSNRTFIKMNNNNSKIAIIIIVFLVYLCTESFQKVFFGYFVVLYLKQSNKRLGKDIFMKVASL
jgi:hypothetical protein